MIKSILYLTIAFFIVSCGSKRDPDPKNLTAKVNSPILPLNPNVNVYIENSGSMDGYIKGNTEFKGAIRDLLVLLKHHYTDNGKIKVYFINTTIRESSTQDDLATFAQNINAQWSVQGEDHSSSSLNNIFKLILNETNKETISILFSDCIYSIHGHDAESLLSDEKSLTKDAFLSRWRKDSLSLATTIVKMQSKFTGYYYDKNNNRTNITGQNRPYYICIIASKNVINDFNSKIPLEKGKIEGFENKFIMSSGSTGELYYSVLLSSFNIGRFKPQRSGSNDTIHGIRDIKITPPNKFTFAIAVDMRNVEVEEDFLLNPENYIFSDNNFIIKEITSLDRNRINDSDWIRVGKNKPTHVIIFEATGTAHASFSVALKKQIPHWIDQTNITDDTDMKNNIEKTFGIKYLIEGINEAYETIYPDDKYYFELNILIKK